MSHRLIFTVLALLITQQGQADIYKYVDKQGHVTYTDKPEFLPTDKTAKKQPLPTDQQALADRMAAELKARDTTAKAQSVTKHSEPDKKNATENNEANKANQCLQARGKYENLTTSHRVYTLDSKGERIYLDEKQLEQAISSAKNDIETWCQ